MSKGKFITLEGSEGSGKSTQSALLVEYLKKKKYPVMLLREPGGVKISEQIRALLLDVQTKNMCNACETLLYMAARAQLVQEVLRPQLNKGMVIICDRFLDSTIAYQGAGNGVDVNAIEQIGQFATDGIKPDLTLLFDIDAAKGLSRTAPKKDRIEQRPLAYHQRVRQGYLDLARRNPERIKVIPVLGSKEEVFELVKANVEKIL